MNKRVLAGLLSLVIAFTSVSLPENVFAAQNEEQRSVETMESVLSETEQIFETVPTEQEETEKKGEYSEADEILAVETEEISEEKEETEYTKDTEEIIEIEETENMTEQQKLSSDKEKEVDSALENEMSVSGTNSFGNLLAEELSKKTEEQQENNGCNVFSVEVTGTEAVVSFETTEDAALVVGIYDEAGVKMVASGSLEVYSGETLVVVDIETESMPQYFYVRGFLVESDTLRPLCTAYESPIYTQEMQEFLAKTTADFDVEKVLNLDEDTTNNFAVYSDETIIIPETTGENQVVTVDEENNTYVIENADETVTSLQEGDIFAHEYGDGEVLIVKVAAITINGTTVTITGAEASMEEVFDYVKIDAEAGTTDADIDPSTCDEGVTYEGLVDYTEEGEAQAYAIDDEITASTALSMKINLKEPGGEKLNASITGGVDFKLGASVKVYISAKYQYFEFEMNYSSKLNLSVSGKIKPISVNLPSIKILPLPAVVVSYNPTLEISVDVKMDFSGTIKGTVGLAVASDTGVRSLTSNPKLITTLELEGTLFIGFSFKPAVSVEIIKVKLVEAGLEGQIGVESVSKKTIYTDKTETKIHDCEHCIQGEIFAKGSVSIKVKLLKTEFKYDMIGIKAKLGDWYYSRGRGKDWTACPYFQYKTTVTLLNVSNEKVVGGKIAGDFSVLTSQGTLASTETITTGEDGKAVGYLPAGTYTLIISADGYETVKKKITVLDDAKEVVVRIKNTNENTESGVIEGKKVKKISIKSFGFTYSCGAITEDGCLYMWGDNEYGQLGDGTKINKEKPVKIMEHVKDFAVLDDRSGAVTEDGDLYMWGSGYLGNGTTNDSDRPVKIMEHIKKVNLGGSFAGAITEDGSLYMWGSNWRGTLGTDQISTHYADSYSLSPIKIMEHVKDISFGSWHAAALTEDGSLYTWGQNMSGELGNGTENEYNIVPQKTMEHVSKISLGNAYSGAITEDGSLYMWGQNVAGELGDGSPIRYDTGEAFDSAVPIKVLENVEMISLGDGHCGAVTRDGDLYMWGSNTWGGLGDGTYKARNIPVKVMSNIGAVAAGCGYSGVITKDGGMYMWGWNCIGQLGNGTTIDSNVPIQVVFPFDTAQVSQDILAFEDTNDVDLKVRDVTDESNSFRTVVFSDLLPEEWYNFYVMKSKFCGNLLNSDNLLYIGQVLSNKQGEMSITFETRENGYNAEVFVVGITQTDISDARVIVPDIQYDGTEQYVTPQVAIGGITLIEGRDYELTTGYSATNVGTYTLTISGIGTYTGTVSADYQVICHHTYTEAVTKQPTCTEKGEKNFQCSICGDSYTETVAETGHSYSSEWTIDKTPSCSEEGSKSHHCTVCGATVDVTAISKPEHTYQDVKVTKKATTSKNGTVEQKCTVCGATQTVTIYAVKKAAFSENSIVYNGKAKKPEVIVTDSQGNELKNKTDYAVTYPKNAKNVGKYTVTIKLKGKYTGTVKKTFTIKPKTTSVSKVTASSKGFTVKWKKQKKQTTGYEIQYSTSSKFTKKTTKTVKIMKNSTTSKKIAKLKAKKKYYVRIRTYKTVKVNGKSTKIYSDWSKSKSITTKK